MEITHRRILNIAFPMIAANVTVPLLGLVDTAVIGQAGIPALTGAIGIGATILSSIYWIFGFLRMGTTGLAAQAKGAENAIELDTVLARALLIGLLAGGSLILLHPLIFWIAMEGLISGNDAVESGARSYMDIRIWSAPAAIALYGLTGWLIANERAKDVLILQLVLNGTNAALDVLFVLVMDWGIEGIAAATFIAEWVGFFLGIWWLRNTLILSRKWSTNNLLDKGRLIGMARINADIMIRSAALLAMMMAVPVIAVSLGEIELAASYILLQFLSVIAFALDGFAFAAESLVGQAKGAGSIKRFRNAALRCSAWGAIGALALALIFLLFGSFFIEQMSTSDELRHATQSYFPWLLLALLIGWPAWMLDGIYIGATETREMRNMMLISLIFYGFCLAIFVPLYGNHGLWISLNLSYVARATTLGWRYPKIERHVPMDQFT